MLTLQKFRRSMKSDKHDSATPVQVSIPQKDAIAIEPPIKVRMHRRARALTQKCRPGDHAVMLTRSFSTGYQSDIRLCCARRL